MAQTVTRIKSVDLDGASNHQVVPLRDRLALARPGKSHALSDDSDIAPATPSSSDIDLMHALEAGVQGAVFSGAIMPLITDYALTTWAPGLAESKNDLHSGVNADAPRPGLADGNDLPQSGLKPDVFLRRGLGRSSTDTSDRLLMSMQATAALDTATSRALAVQGVAMNASPLIASLDANKHPQKVDSVSPKSDDLHNSGLFRPDARGESETDDTWVRSLPGHEKSATPVAGGLSGSVPLIGLDARSERRNTGNEHPMMHAMPSQADVASPRPAAGAASTLLTYAFTTWTGQPVVTANLGRRQLMGSSAGVRGGLREALSTAPGLWRVDQTAGDESGAGGCQDEQP